MTTTKKSVIAAAIVATLGMGAFGTATAFAATDTSIVHKPMQNLVTAIAKKFNVKEADVQAVFDEQHATMQEQRQENIADHLTKAVTDGKLTQAQADAIAANMETQKTFFESLKDKTPEERQAALKANAETQKAWAESNDLPKEFAPGQGLRGRGPGGMHRGSGGMMRGQGMMNGGDVQEDNG
ncbi:MAG: hypothetical protein AAB473_05350 [Patescibacteria group bacterium]